MDHASSAAARAGKPRAVPQRPGRPAGSGRHARRHTAASRRVARRERTAVAPGQGTPPPPRCLPARGGCGASVRLAIVIVLPFRPPRLDRSSQAR
jgi:hypothetical protein